MAFIKLSNDASNLVRDTRDVARDMFRPSLRLGVTGLARAGKTVFITSLIHNLLSGGRLPFFHAAAQGRIRRAYLEPPPDDIVPRFAYEDYLAILTGDPPAWPDSTKRVSQLRLTLEYEPTGWVRGTFGRKLQHIDIVDYPGEWLLDLPLLNLSYREWSQQSLELAKTPERHPFASDWLQLVDNLPAERLPIEEDARLASNAFKAYLERCRNADQALAPLSPGRFLLPGELFDSPALTFSPLLPPQRRRVSKRSLWAMMERRFEAYKTHIVKPFFRDHFSRLHRQIILVDALSALNAGPGTLNDLERTIAGIFLCFRPGRAPWLRLPWRSRIDKILFAATKADHLHHTSHGRLNAILDLITERAKTHARYHGADVGTLAIAAIRSTSEAEALHNGQQLPCIVGVPLEGERLHGRLFRGVEEIAVFPGDLPENPEEALASGRQAATLGYEEMRFIRFRPPKTLPGSRGAPGALPHIRLDHALEFLLGDRLT